MIIWNKDEDKIVLITDGYINIDNLPTNNEVRFRTIEKPFWIALAFYLLGFRKIESAEVKYGK
jgi:hypothetical protein